MNNQTTSVNVDELRRAQAAANESFADSSTQYGNANSSVESHVGNDGDGSIGGKLGTFVSNQWQDDTSALVARYKQHADHLLNDALSSITTNAQNLAAETESVYKA